VTASLNPEQTYLACLTPGGNGAIATLALVGPASVALLQELFQPRTIQPGKANFLAEACQTGRSGQFWLGKLGEGTGGPDEVVLALKRTAPVPWFEIHCHGGRQVITLLEELFAIRGVRLCSWPELMRQTDQSPLQVEALKALGEATTVRTAAILLDQYHGAFERAVEDIRESVRHSQFELAERQLRELARWVPLGRHLTQPWRVAVVGAPNVGKSSLINRIAGYQRCVVSPTPGTTRDVVTTRSAVDGWPVELIDTAGMRDQAEMLEAQGIEMALAAAAGADVCMWMLDASTPPGLPPRPLPSLRYVINKVDLTPAWDFAGIPEAIPLCATSGAGVNELLMALSSWLVPECCRAGMPVPFTERLGELVETAWDNCQKDRWDEVKQMLYNTLPGAGNETLCHKD
jgi:tRNA modification GTPase